MSRTMIKLIDKDGKPDPKAIEKVQKIFLEEKFFDTKIEQKYRDIVTESITVAVSMGLVAASESLDTYEILIKDTLLTDQENLENTYNIGDLLVRCRQGVCETRRPDGDSLISILPICHPHRREADTTYRPMCTGDHHILIPSPRVSFVAFVTDVRSTMMSYCVSLAYFAMHNLCESVLSITKSEKLARKFYASDVFPYYTLAHDRFNRWDTSDQKTTITKIALNAFKENNKNILTNSPEYRNIVARRCNEFFQSDSHISSLLARLVIEKSEDLLEGLLVVNSLINSFNPGEYDKINSLADICNHMVRVQADRDGLKKRLGELFVKAEKFKGHQNVEAAIEKINDRLGLTEENRVSFEEIFLNRVVRPSVVPHSGEESQGISPSF